jgi:hypothetical protein
MKPRATVLILTGTLAALALLATACTLPARDDVELAKTLMQSVESGSPSADYKSSGSKVAPPPGIHVTLVSWDPLPVPATGDWGCSLSAQFTDFVPPGHERSAATGSVDARLVISFVKGSATDLSLHIDGAVEVAGENAGTYDFNATLRYDFGTRLYSYSGTVTINGETHTFKG